MDRSDSVEVNGGPCTMYLDDANDELLKSDVNMEYNPAWLLSGNGRVESWTKN
jgi:hypothetical protein